MADRIVYLCVPGTVTVIEVRMYSSFILPTYHGAKQRRR